MVLLIPQEMIMAEPSKRPRRNNRDPEATHKEILQAALEVLAKDGPESLNVTEVARRAGINRGTAYQHFPTREDLVHATTNWVSERMLEEFYGDRNNVPDTEVYPPDLAQERLSRFAMNNPELSRAWLFDVMTTEGTLTDPFWTRYVEELGDFADRGYSRDGLDVEVYAFISLVSSLLWPIWVSAHGKTTKTKKQMHQRFIDESIRLGLFGSLAPEPNKALREKYKVSPES